MTWGDILARWNLACADMAECYGWDEEDPHVWRERSWPWLRRRLIGLAARPDTRLAISLTDD